MLREGPGGRTADVLARQVETAIVAGAPNHGQVLAIADGTRKVGASRREGAPFIIGGVHQYCRPGAEREDLSTAGGQLARIRGQHGTLGPSFGAGGRENE